MPARRPSSGLRLGGLVLTLGLALTACGPAGSDGGARADGTGPNPSSSATIPAPLPRLDLPTTAAAFDEPLQFGILEGALKAVAVTGAQYGTPLPGRLQGSGWVSNTTPVSGATYTVLATATDRDGASHQLSSTVQIAVVPPERSLAATITPYGGTVGVGAPIVLRFTKEVPDRRAIENLLQISTSTPIRGGLRWTSARELHFRPESYWPSGTKVQVRLPLLGRAVGEKLWGIRDSQVAFTVGQKRVAVVDGGAHTMSVQVDGQPAVTWPTSLGKREFQTRTGTYVVLEKVDTLQMTSCSVKITCDKKDPNYYDLKVNWDVRLTYSGTFIHSAPWSATSQGRDNVSHGCINLSEEHAKAYFAQAAYGDIVTVSGTARGPADLLSRGDPGMADWNMSFGDYVAGSATGAPIMTGALVS